jgi:hypothetical protein
LKAKLKFFIRFCCIEEKEELKIRNEREISSTN